MPKTTLRTFILKGTALLLFASSVPPIASGTCVRSVDSDRGSVWESFRDSPQDTTRHPQEKKTPSPSEVSPMTFPSLSIPVPPSSPGTLRLLNPFVRQIPGLTLEMLDSLGRVHPELKDYLLQQGILQGALRYDSAQMATRKLLDRALADITLPGELEAKLRRNQALYGTTENPMKPPPPPYQVDLFAVMTALSNLLHYLGMK